MADLFTISLISGGVYRYTSADIPITVGLNTFLHDNVIVERGSIRSVSGIEVDTLNLEVKASNNHFIDGVQWMTAAIDGRLDGAVVLIERAFMTDWALPPVGTLVLFSGLVSDLSATRSKIDITVKSSIERLNTKMPRNLYQASCSLTVYDSNCLVNKVAFTISSSATVNSTTGQYIQSGLANPDGWFDQGVVTFTSGGNNLLKRTVKSFIAGKFTFALELPTPPLIGDTFTVFPGCDKTQTTCTSKFNNLIRFRGFPYIPAPEVSI